MADQPTAVIKFPEKIYGVAVGLQKDGPTLWPFVQKLSQSEVTEILQYSRWGEEDRQFFDSSVGYQRLCQHNNQWASENLAGDFRIISIRDQRLVGEVNGRLRQENGATIYQFDIHINSAFRMRGFASDTVKTISDYIFGQDMARYICGEAEPTNESSIKLMQSLGFREYAMGLCSTSSLDEFVKNPMRRFLKTKGEPPPVWPLSPPSSILAP